EGCDGRCCLSRTQNWGLPIAQTVDGFGAILGPVSEQRDMDPRSKTRQISPVLVAVAVILGLSPAVSAQSPERRFEEAQRAQQNGDNALAATLYQSLLEEHPESTSAHANLGVALVALGKFDDAIEQYRIALEQAPGNRQLRSNLALAHYKKGDFEGASEEFFTLYQEERGDIP